jgi:hypothetical protein
MLVLECSFYILPLVLELEFAIFLVCVLQYFLISAFLVFGYIVVYC